MRKILVTTKRQVGNKVYQARAVPPLVNMAVIADLHSSIILFPATIAQWLAGRKHQLVGDIAATLPPPAGMSCFTRPPSFSSASSAAVQPEGDGREPEEGRRSFRTAGDQTAKYLEKITLRLTLLGSLYLVVVCFIPNFLIAWKNVPFYFGGTSLLIIVVVTMDFMTQVPAYLMSQQYESLLRKANFKGGLPTR